MPYLSKKICNHSRCANTVSRKERYCPQHRKEDPYHQNETHPWYNKSIWRGNPNKPIGKRGGLRERQLLEEPFCQECKDEPATSVDHITPWKTGKSKSEQWELFIDTNNHQSLCKHCHRVKTRAEDEARRNAQ